MGENLHLQEYRQHQFAGAFPTIPTYDHVDTELLYQGDDDPFHVVLPIARVGEVSANKLEYDNRLVKEIEEQLAGMGGIRGHKTDSQFPLEDHDLIGHLREDDTLWGKFYVPPGDRRNDLRRRKARGGGVATSIYGPYEKRETGKNGTWRARGLKLQRVDFGAPDQTALNLAGGAFAIVSELDESTEVDDMDRDQIIAELTINDLPAALRQQVVEEYRQDQEDQNVVSELRGEIENKDQIISELTQKVNGFQVREFHTVLDGMIAEMVKIELLRPIVRRAVVAEMGQDMDTEKAKEALTVYTETDEYKALAKAMVAEMGGPAAFVGAATTDDNWRDKFAKNSAQLAKEAGV